MGCMQGTPLSMGNASPPVEVRRRSRIVVFDIRSRGASSVPGEEKAYRARAGS